MKFIKLLILLILISACSSKKSILLLQDIEDGYNYSFNYTQYKIQPDDVLKIQISTESASILSNNSNISSTSSQVLNNLDAFILNGYKVTPDGLIFYPQIGSISVIGLTIDQIRQKIKLKLTSDEI